jgi:hypothetical protein
VLTPVTALQFWDGSLCEEMDKGLDWRVLALACLLPGPPIENSGLLLGVSGEQLPSFSQQREDAARMITHGANGRMVNAGHDKHLSLPVLQMQVASTAVGRHHANRRTLMGSQHYSGSSRAAAQSAA